jgi:hypothetical protein
MLLYIFTHDSLLTKEIPGLGEPRNWEITFVWEGVDPPKIQGFQKQQSDQSDNLLVSICRRKHQVSMVLHSPTFLLGDHLMKWRKPSR